MASCEVYQTAQVTTSDLFRAKSIRAAVRQILEDYWE
jgi:hypothetical protein